MDQARVSRPEFRNSVGDAIIYSSIAFSWLGLVFVIIHSIYRSYTYFKLKRTNLSALAITIQKPRLEDSSIRHEQSDLINISSTGSHNQDLHHGTQLTSHNKMSRSNMINHYNDAELRMEDKSIEQQAEESAGLGPNQELNKTRRLKKINRPRYPASNTNKKGE